MNIRQAQRPSSADYYLAHDRGGHLDHHVLFHGIDSDAIAHLKAADILFVGTSRMMFAIRSRVVTPWAESHGLRYYALGFGFREGDAFALDLIRRHDLRPGLVVVNVDGYFARPLTTWAHRVAGDTPFGARKRVFEGELAHDTRRLVHQVVPNWIDLYGRPGFPFGREFIAYRSRVNGVWAISPWQPATTPATMPDFQVEPVGPRLGDAARAFKAELDQRGSRVVLTYVPTPEGTEENPVAIGAMLGVPVIGMNFDGLTSHDGSHLSEASAVAWSERLVRDLTPYLPPPRPQ